ncbi:MAG: glycosyl hydrolase 115 family protein [Gemmatimonadaceae bacterium]|nr:glycosyl hydrolase 115 family protein [Gemmatimonadaceae bacterium]
MHTLSTCLFAILVSLGIQVVSTGGLSAQGSNGTTLPGVAALRERKTSAATWARPLRGTWVADEREDAAGVALVAQGSGSEIIVSERENTAVLQAARFLSGDIASISGFAPAIVTAPASMRVRIHLATLGIDTVPAAINQVALQGRWEAYQILTQTHDVWLVGSDSRGTAYAAYTLSERLGIDPLYLWTGYTPVRHKTLILKPTNYIAGPPAFRYRGMFHDDEDILPRPFEDSGYPLRIGDIPLDWYERFFETALRLKMNMVAPYTRVHRRYEVQKLASDWGLFYTSHHYDILLSNPFGMERFGLGRARAAGSSWDWYSNREGMLNYWRGGVLENRALDAIWPVGLRGAEDRAYEFPPNTSDSEQARVFRAVVDSQIGIARSIVPAGRDPVFAFTLYSEMLAKFERHALDVPPDVILVWPDDNDGVMRGLPAERGKWKHGVYYHLAYFGGPAKQVTHTVTPMRVAGEFRRIVDAQATEYLLVNVSELRDFVMETRMIADIAWDGEAALGGTEPESRFVNWWTQEYFGESAAKNAALTYAHYYKLLDRFDGLWRGSDKFQDALSELHKRFTGVPYHQIQDDTVAVLRARDNQYRAAKTIIDRASRQMGREQRQFFFDNAVLGLLIDWRPTQAALLLSKALREPDPVRAWALVEASRLPLETLENEIRRSEWPPFDEWYRKTWIRRETRPSNVHRSYEQLRVFLSSGGTRELAEPPGAAHPDLRRFCEKGNVCSGPKAVIPLR